MCDQCTTVIQLRAIIARADARIAELERKLAFARVGSDRYQIARRMNPRQWAAAWQVNVKLGKPFDQIIDEMRPFVMDAIGESGDGG